MVKPKISVIIPVYNCWKYLEKCLNTIRYQTYENLEVICVDDGSTDGSSGILKWFQEKDSRFKVYKINHSGVSTARNKGIAEAGGEYISFIDADDWVLLDLYNVFVKTLNKTDTEPDIFMFNASFYNPHKSDLLEGRFFELSDWNNHKSELTIHTFNDCVRPFTRNLGVYNKIYRREFLQEKNIKFPDGMKYEDNYFWVKAALEAQSIVFTDEVYYRYRQHDSGSLSSSVSPLVFDIFKIMDMVEGVITDLNVYDNYKYALFQYKYNIYINMYNRCPEDLKDKFYNEMKSRLLEAEKKNIDERIYSQLTNYKLFTMVKTCTRNEFDEFISS